MNIPTQVRMIGEDGVDVYPVELVVAEDGKFSYRWTATREAVVWALVLEDDEGDNTGPIWLGAKA